MKVFEVKMLRRISGLKSKKITRRCKELHNVDLYNLCSSLNIIKVVKSSMVGYVAWMEEVKVHKNSGNSGQET
jgi:hypothetical protein